MARLLLFAVVVLAVARVVVAVVAAAGLVADVCVGLAQSLVRVAAAVAAWKTLRVDA